MCLLAILLFTFSFLLPSLAIASPLAIRQFDQEEYYLKTRTKDPFNDKNNLYVLAYHTGAGLNDVLLVPNMTRASKGYFNDGYQMFEFRTIFPWRMNMGGSANSAAWAPVNINAAGEGTSGFRIEQNTLQWGDKGSGFTGWLACDWFYGSPQLFWRNGNEKSPAPCSCADVSLEIVLVQPDLDTTLM